MGKKALKLILFYQLEEIPVKICFPIAKSLDFPNKISKLLPHKAIHISNRYSYLWGRKNSRKIWKLHILWSIKCKKYIKITVNWTKYNVIYKNFSYHLVISGWENVYMWLLMLFFEGEWFLGKLMSHLLKQIH